MLERCFDDHLVLRPFDTPDFCETERLPKQLISGKTYHFLKKGDGYLQKDSILYEGAQDKPVARITLHGIKRLEVEGQVWVCGRYVVEEIFKTSVHVAVNSPRENRHHHLLHNRK